MELETLEIKIPKELLVGIEKRKFVEDIKLFIAMKLYEEGVLSLGKAAVLTEKNEEELMEVLSEHGIDVIRYPKDELDEEKEFLKEIK